MRRGWEQKWSGLGVAVAIWAFAGVGCGSSGGGDADVPNGGDVVGDVGGDADVSDTTQEDDLGQKDLLGDTADAEEPQVWGPEFEWEQIPEPAAAYRPWVRWWWPGGDVEDEELIREVKQLVSQGFGGAEIQAMEAALNPNASAEELARRRSYDSEEFLAHVRTVLAAAREEGLGIDLTAGSGWPTGGTHVAVEDSLKTLVYNLIQVTGPKKGTYVFTEPDKMPFYQVSEMAAGFGEPMARYLPEEAKLVEVLVARVTGGELNTNILKINDSISVDPESVQVVTAQLQGGKQLSWEFPEGKWILMGFWSMPDGGFVSLAAQAEKGFVADHFQAGLVDADLEHLLGERTGYAEYAGKPWRGFFNDSFEFKTERHFTADFLEEFATRRGYDLRPWLPAAMMPGADNHIFDGGGIAAVCPFDLGEESERIRYDYQLTVSDLFIERFIRECASWGKQHGVLSRVQPYGIRLDVIRAAGEADIPEAEQLYAGGADLFVKMVSSGAHLYNGNLVTAESLVWAGRDYMTTPVKLKAAADKLFAAGVNGLVFHGHPYRKVEGYGQQGWSAFCSPWSGMGTYSSNISEGDSFWEFMPEVNRYLSRVQYLMQAGRSQSDLLVYYPFLGFPASLARMADWVEPLFLGLFGDWEGAAGKNPLYAIVDSVFGPMDAGESGRWLKAHQAQLDGLSDAGYTWDWLNDDALGKAEADLSHVVIRGSRYRAIVVMDAPYMPRKSAEGLAKLAQFGVPVILVGEAPSKQPGYFDRESGDIAVKENWQMMVEGKSLTALESGAAIAPVLGAANYQPLVAVTKGMGAIRLAHRYESERAWTFVANRTGDEVEVALKPESECASGVWLEPWAGTYAVAEAGNGEYGLTLAAYGSAVLVCGASGPEAVSGLIPGVVGVDATLQEMQALEGWSLEVTGSDVTGGAYASDAVELVDWRQIPELAGSSSLGQYRITFDLAQQPVGRAVVSFAWVHGAAVVSVNGQEAGSLLAPPFEVEIGELLLPGENTIEVTLTPSLRNRLLALGDAGDAQYVEFKDKAGTQMPVGLVGPASIRVTP